MKSIIVLPNDYVVLDLETTGRNPNWDDIIEIAAVRYRNGIEVEQFNQLIATGKPIPWFISALTGITDEMLIGKPYLEDVIQEFSDFIGNDILIGHNIAGFDSSFINNAYNRYLSIDLANPCVDTLRIARKILPSLEHHTLSDLAEHYGIPYVDAHRAAADCAVTNACYQKMRSSILENSTESDFQQLFIKKRTGQHSTKVRAKDVVATETDFDPDHPFYHKTIVFTGEIDGMTRKEAMQLVMNCGGFCGDRITQNTNYLVIGTSKYISSIDGKKTNKMRDVEKLYAKGFDIFTLSEDTFFDLLAWEPDSDQVSIPPQAEIATEEQIYELLKDALLQTVESNNLSPEWLTFKPGKAFSSVFFRSQLAFRICCQEPHHYFGVSDTCITEDFDAFESRITRQPSVEGFTNYTFDQTSDGVALYKKVLSQALDVAINSIVKQFDCCSRYEECSNQKRCIHPNPEIALGCGYRKIMKKGRIFYGKNRNI